MSLLNKSDTYSLKNSKIVFLINQTFDSKCSINNLNFFFKHSPLQTKSKMRMFLIFMAITCATLITCATENETARLTCQKWSKSHLDYANAFSFSMTYLAYVHFDTTSQLNINCGHLVDQQIYSLILKSTNRHFKLDFTFNIRSLLDSFVFDSDLIYVQIYNANGFNLDLNLANPKFVEHNISQIDFVFSTFDFYLNETRLITPDLCLRRYFEHSMMNFGNLMMFNNPYYSKNVCPYVFTNSPVKYVFFNQISNSFIYKNQLEFLAINESESLNMPNITSLTVSVNFEHITSKLVNKNIFNNIFIVYLQGYFYDIQVDLFDLSFKRLKVILTVHDSMAALFGKGISWIRHLNRDVDQEYIGQALNDESALDFSRSMYLIFNEYLELDILKKFYAYPEEDLCIFKDFPHRQLVAPIISNAEPIACTCTILWLIQYADLYRKFDSQQYADLESYVKINVTWCLQTTKCNFTDRLSKCHTLETLKRQRENVLGLFEMPIFVNNFYFLQYVVQVYLQPLLCLISIFTNTLIIKAIRVKNIEIKKNLSNIMYKHIQVNSAFNIMYAVIKLCSLVNICITPRSSFCSDIYKLAGSQYFKIYVVYFVGNTVRLGANISYICFSISRYSSSTSNPSPLFRHFQKLNLKVFYSIVLGICSSFSLFKVFQFKVSQKATGGGHDYPFDKYDIEYCQMQDLSALRVRPPLLKCNMFTTFNMINTILNNMVFLFVSILIDLGLVRSMTKNVARKRRLFAGMDTNELNQAIKLKEKVTKMIITNGVLYVVSHLPEFALATLLLAVEKKLGATCQYDFKCGQFIDVAQVTNFFSMSFQILVFKRFDKNFRMNLNIILGIK